MDHFAKPDDELAVAQREGTLYRNFQGYSTHAECDLIALGATSISMVGDTYCQNERDLDDYYRRLDADELPVFRGIELDADDLLRRGVISELICHFGLNFSSIDDQYGIDFHQYFDAEMDDLKKLQSDGLIEMDDKGIQVKPAGRLLIRNVCMVFDRYLRQKDNRNFSKVI